MSTFIRLGLAVTVALLVGCRVELGDRTSPNVEILDWPKSEREQQTDSLEDGAELESVGEERR
jgi:hypothetical protein